MNPWHAPAPGEREAGERSWPVVRAAFATREPVPQERRAPRRTLALAGIVAAVAAGFGAAGAAVVHSLQGSRGARTVLSSFPGGGRLLVLAHTGAWIVRADGSKRRLGDYEDAVWSPHGKFVAATRGHELFALDPEGHVRWSIARRGRVRLPSWNAPDGFRVAYLAGDALHVVAGDGSGDRVVARHVRAVRPAWRPGTPYELAYAGSGRIHVVAADGGRPLWSLPLGGNVTQLAWSADGTRLLVVEPSFVGIYDTRGKLLEQDNPSDATTAAAATFVGGSHRVAEIRVHGMQSDLFLLRNGRTLMNGVGRFSGVASSPGGDWFALAWPTANELMFIPSEHAQKVVGFSGIGDVFGSFPELRGWAR